MPVFYCRRLIGTDISFSFYPDRIFNTEISGHTPDAPSKGFAYTIGQFG